MSCQLLRLLLLLLLFLSFCADEGIAKNKQNKNGQAAGNENKNGQAPGKENKNGQASPAQNNVAPIHRWFKECAIKQRLSQEKNGYVFQTVFANAKMGQKSALFFDLSKGKTGFVSNATQLSLCADDPEAKLADAKEVTEVQLLDRTRLALTVGQDHSIQLGPSECDSDGPYYLYKCFSEACYGEKYVLVKRPREFQIAAIYYIPKKHAGKLLVTCKTAKVMEEVYDNSVKKQRKNKLFQECAVYRSRDNEPHEIETLVKRIQLSASKTLFFSKGLQVYVAERTTDLKEVCEADKAAKMNFPARTAQMKMEKNQLMFQQQSKETEDEKKLKETVQRGKGKQQQKQKPNKQQNKQQKQNINDWQKLKQLSVHGEEEEDKICVATIASDEYNVFHCPSNVCGGQKLILMRKIHKAGSNRKRLDIDKESDSVDVDQVYVVSNVLRAVLNKVRAGCGGHMITVEGVRHVNQNNRKGQKKAGEQENNRKENNRKEDTASPHASPSASAAHNQPKKDKQGHQAQQQANNRKGKQDSKPGAASAPQASPHASASSASSAHNPPNGHSASAGGGGGAACSRNGRCDTAPANKKEEEKHKNEEEKPKKEDENHKKQQEKHKNEEQPKKQLIRSNSMPTHSDRQKEEALERKGSSMEEKTSESKKHDLKGGNEPKNKDPQLLAAAKKREEAKKAGMTREEMQKLKADKAKVRPNESPF